MPLAAWCRVAGGATVANSASDETESRERPARDGHRSARDGDKGVVDLAGEALKDIAVLLQTELQLLRAEISEKLTFTALSAALIGAGGLLLMATIVLLLQAAIAGLVAYGICMPVEFIVVAVITFLCGVGIFWF